MPAGILIVDKSPGWTSQDVAARLRGVFRERRIGHGGTLDPMATGVLPIFVGRATRAVEFFEAAEKEYIAGLRLGLVTNTQDTSGEVLSQTDAAVSRQQVLEVFARFLGEQQQLPPMYSAVKIGGKRLYQLAREGKTVQRQPRTVTIRELELLEGHGAEYVFRVRCSKGTYVRTLCHDMGQALGCGGCMSSLRRTVAGPFTLEGARTMDQILAFSRDRDPAELLLPVDRLFDHLPACTLTEREVRLCRNGAAIRRTLPPGRWRVYGPGGEFLMVGQAEGGLLTTVKSFFEVSAL